ncbi:MAG: hypothetical protein IT291_00150 [Deltaproteobacteria bacterium]|nr:hypothetical protein [Deltaproteobacteria bacterium]
MLCIFVCAMVVLVSMRGDPFFEAIIPAKIIQLIFFSFFFLLLVSNVIAAIGNLFSADCMNFFLIFPVSTTRLYFARLLSIMAETSPMYFIFAFPIALAYCLSLGLGVRFLIVGLSVSIPFLFILSGISVVIASILMAVSMYIKKRKQFFGLLLLFSIGYAALCVIGKLASLDIKRGAQSANVIVQAIGVFSNPSPLWLPSRWASDVLTSFVGEPLVGKNIQYLLLICSAIGSIAAGYLTFDLFFLKIKSRVESGEVSRRKVREDFVGVRLFRRVHDYIYRYFPMSFHARAIFRKDFLTILRDPTRSLQCALYFVIGALYVLSFRFMGAALDIGGIGDQAWLALMASLNILLGGFILASVMTRLVYPSISLEGKAFWILRTAPIDLKRLIAIKFSIWLPITILCAMALLVSSAIVLRIDAFSVMYTVFVAIVLSIGCSGLAVGLGATFASFEWESHTQLTSGLGTMVLMVCTLGLVFMTCILSATLFFLQAIPRLRDILGHSTAGVIMATSMFAILWLNFLVAKLACERGVRSLESSLSQA